MILYYQDNGYYHWLFSLYYWHGQCLVKCFKAWFVDLSSKCTCQANKYKICLMSRVRCCLPFVLSGCFWHVPNSPLVECDSFSNCSTFELEVNVMRKLDASYLEHTVQQTISKFHLFSANCSRITDELPINPMKTGTSDVYIHRTAHYIILPRCIRASGCTKHLQK